MERSSIRVLLVDDSPDDILITSRALSAIREPRFLVESAVSLSLAIDRCREGEYEIVLLDLGLPDSPRTETLARFRKACGDDLAIIILTGLADEEMALDALDRGAQDYIDKNDLTPHDLSRSIRYALTRQHLLRQLNGTNSLLEQKNVRLAQLCDTAQQFVENVSHEFRTPLTVIREFTSIMRDGLSGPVTSQQSDQLTKVLNRTDDLTLMVDDMLDIGRLEAGLLGVCRKKCQAADLIEDVANLLGGRAASKNISLSVVAPADLPAVFCDEEKARRVIVNLAVNAIKFAPEGGTVQVWARKSDSRPDVEIGVTDNGPGIARENLELIFDRFKQVEQSLYRSTNGFGLGLNIAKALVSLNFGHIDVESQVGVGSTFLFTLPPFEPRIIFDRFLDRLALVSSDSTDVSLLSVEADVNDSDTVEVIARFLQRFVRSSDLVMPRISGHWTVVTVCSELGCQDLIQRLTADWDGFARNSPQIHSTALRIRHRGTWLSAARREALTEAFIRLCHDGGSDGASPLRLLVTEGNRKLPQCVST